MCISGTCSRTPPLKTRDPVWETTPALGVLRAERPDPGAVVTPGAQDTAAIPGGVMRLAIRLLGLDLLAVEISTDADASEFASPDLGCDVVYSEPTGTLGFSLPSTEYEYGDDE